MPVYPLYIDPGAGSILLQVLVAGAAGVVWRVVYLFRRWTGAGTRPADKPDRVTEEEPQSEHPADASVSQDTGTARERR